MTHNETKILRWSTPETRLTGRSWSGELDVEEVTTDAMVYNDSTLLTHLVHGRVLQITPSAVHLHPDITIPCDNENRIIHASCYDNNVAVLLHIPTEKTFRLTH